MRLSKYLCEDLVEVVDDLRIRVDQLSKEVQRIEKDIAGLLRYASDINIKANESLSVVDKHEKAISDLYDKVHDMKKDIEKIEKKVKRLDKKISKS